MSTSAPAQPTGTTTLPAAPELLDAVKRIWPGSNAPMRGVPSVVCSTPFTHAL